MLTVAGYNVEEYLNTDGAFNVTSVDFMKTKSPEGYNVNATVAFRNPSPFIVDLVSQPTNSYKREC